MKAPIILSLILFSISAMTYVGYTMSYNTIHGGGGYREANPLATGLINHPGWAVPVITIFNGGLALGLVSIQKDNSTLAWIMAAGLMVLHGLVLYHNIRIGARF